MTDTDVLKEAVALGEEAKIFLNSPLGKYLQERSHIEIERARDELETIDPEDHKRIQKVQNNIARHRDFHGWLLEVVDAGDLAYVQYQDGEEEA